MVDCIFTGTSGVLAASIDVIGIPKRVLTSPELAAYVMAEGDDGEEGGRAEVRKFLRREHFHIIGIGYSEQEKEGNFVHT